MLIWLQMTLISLWDGTLPICRDKLFLRPCLVGSVGQMVLVYALTAVQCQPVSALVLQMEPVLLVEQSGGGRSLGSTGFPSIPLSGPSSPR